MVVTTVGAIFLCRLTTEVRFFGVFIEDKPAGLWREGGKAELQPAKEVRAPPTGAGSLFSGETVTIPGEVVVVHTVKAQYTMKLRIRAATVNTRTTASDFPLCLGPPKIKGMM